jgi:hypothetical protein
MIIAKSSQRLKIPDTKDFGRGKAPLNFGREFVCVRGLGGYQVVLKRYCSTIFKRFFHTDVSLECLPRHNHFRISGRHVFVITLLVGGLSAVLLNRLGTLQSLKGKLETGSNRVHVMY